MIKRIMPQRILAAIMILILGGMMMTVFSGCGAESHKIDFGAEKGFYQNAKDSYRTGERVTVYLDLIATDTKYSFYLDGEPLDYRRDSQRGIEISFVMPDHDVKLTCEKKNLTEVIPEPSTQVEGEMLVDYYRAVVATVGGDGFTEYTLYTYSADRLKLSCFERYENSMESEESRLVSLKILDDCMRVIEDADMARWNELEDIAPAMLGAALAVRFHTDSGYIRVSSDHMPEGGDAAMNRVGDLLSSAFSAGEAL